MAMDEINFITMTQADPDIKNPADVIVILKLRTRDTEH